MRANHLKGTHVVPKSDAEKLADAAFEAVRDLEHHTPWEKKDRLWKLHFYAERVHEREEAMREAPYV